ncbi:MAG TPA: hypothetical protein VGG30_11190 [Pirellulales bacterium]|jgi:hypothetical protein
MLDEPLVGSADMTGGSRAADTIILRYTVNQRHAFQQRHAVKNNDDAFLHWLGGAGA